MARRNEEERLTELTKIEREYWAKGILPAGMDEVGRGPLAGPVVTACVMLPPEPLIKYVNDSKMVSQGRREKLYPEIKAAAIACATGWKSPEDIDELNILNATRRAFEQAFRAMEQKPEVVFLDAMTGVDMDAE
ncbi:MAG: ribonuclease HII, partial [Clostridia bacterium]|nr:ribonuclease HII [Clostridia bacterium]